MGTWLAGCLVAESVLDTAVIVILWDIVSVVTLWDVVDVVSKHSAWYCMYIPFFGL